MNKKEMKEKVSALISSGVEKSSVFAQLSGQGVKDSRLAHLIASYADPRLCEENKRKVYVIIAIMFIQAAIYFLFGFGIGAETGTSAGWVIGGLCALIPLLFAWGFYKHFVGAYDTYILLSCGSFSTELEDFSSSPVETIIAIAIQIIVLVFISLVRAKIFPRVAIFVSLLSPKKVKGQYVFS